MIAGFTCVLCCGADAREWRAEDEWQVVRCKGCDLLATWPRPDDATLEHLYAAPEYFEARSMGKDAAVAWLARGRAILDLLPSVDGPMLDFGAGAGHFVRAARRMGVWMEGVEPSGSARALARALYGIELWPRLPPPTERRYPAVTLIHVLEHLRNPVDELRTLRPVMDSDGVLFLEVPHAGSADMWLPSRREAILDLPAHLHHFTPTTLRKVLAASGYEVLDVRLFNSLPIERILALRPTGSGSQGDVQAARQEASSSMKAPTTWALRALARRLLAGTRRFLPGDKFQVLARPAR